MKLMMFLGNDLIEAVPVNVEDLRIPGYLGKFKRTLQVKYDELIRASAEKPEFLVINTTVQQPPASKEN